jgi:DNA polymerase IV
MHGMEQSFLAHLDVGKIPGVGKVTKSQLNELGIHLIGDLMRADPSFLERRFGKWGAALAGKARGEDAGGWFEGEVGDDWEAKSISHEHTFGEDTRDRETLEATLLRLSEMVGRRLREHGYNAHTIQLKLRYSDFTTITRARSIHGATTVDSEIFSNIRGLFQENWQPGRTVRLLGVQASNFQDQPEQMNLLDGSEREKWGRALSASDRLRDKYGDSAIFLAKGMKQKIREKVHENPAEKKMKDVPDADEHR